MPIDPRKFKRLVTNHFATVTDEEFLKNLRKSSPYLFTENLEAEKDVHFSGTSDLNSDGCHEVIDRQNTEEHKIDRYRKIIKSLISNYANSDIANDKVEVQLLLDTDRDHY